VWIDRLVREVQNRGLWDSAKTMHRTPGCGIDRNPIWENPARISRSDPIQTSLTSINGLLRFKNSERIVAGLPQPLMKG
jgi:hypothetical protein